MNLNKQLLHKILSNTNSNNKKEEIIKEFGDYNTNLDLRKAIYEKVEGFFHDGLGTLFEIEVHNQLIDDYNLDKELKISDENIRKKLNNAKQLFEELNLFENYKNNYDLEEENIIKSSKKIYDLIKEKNNGNLIEINHTPNDYLNNNARDISLIFDDKSELNISLKTDKSGKVALAEIGQTPKVDKLFNVLFNLELNEYNNLLIELFNTNDFSTIRKDFQNICLLLQKVLIKQFDFLNAEINDFSNVEFNNLENIKFFLNSLKKYKNGRDNSFVIVADRLKGELIFETILDRINIDEIKLEDFSTSNCKRKTNSKYKYTTTYAFKFKGKTFVDFQVKHKRGKYASLEFGDITTRLRI